MICASKGSLFVLKLKTVIKVLEFPCLADFYIVCSKLKH